MGSISLGPRSPLRSHRGRGAELSFLTQKDLAVSQPSSGLLQEGMGPLRPDARGVGGGCRREGALVSGKGVAHFCREVE